MKKIFIIIIILLLSNNNIFATYDNITITTKVSIFILPEYEDVKYNIFDLEKNLNNPFLNIEIRESLEKNKSCSGILELKRVKGIKKNMFDSYSKAFKGKSNINTLEIFEKEIEDAENSYLERKDLYEFGVQNNLNNKITSINTGKTVNESKFQILIKGQEEYILYRKGYYALPLLKKDLENFEPQITKKCISILKEINEKEEENEKEENEKEENKKMPELTKNTSKENNTISNELQEKMNNIEKSLPIFYKKYPKKILDLLPSIKTMKNNFSEDSENYLLLNFLEEKIEKLKD